MAISKDDEDDGILSFQQDPYVKNLLEQGLSLSQVSTKTEEELAIVQESIVVEHLLQSRNILGLNSLLDDMDLLLSRMEQTLGVYQQDIKRMNQDISIIQLDSKLLDTKVKNRRLAHGLTAELLEGIIVSPDLIKKIVDAEINEFYITNLAELDAKLKYVAKHQSDGIKALQTVMPELERLRLKAAEKIREFYLKKIDSFKAPNTNIALIQQNIFLKYRELFWFLMDHAQPVGLEIHQNYICHVQAYFLNSFERYYKSLILLQSGSVDKNELIGVDENAKRGLFGAIKIAPVKETVNIYGLADRLLVLTSSESGIIVPDHAKEVGKKFPFEALFKSLTRLFIDNASSEYVFTSEFFSNPKNPIPHASVESFFSQTFEPTMKFVESMIKQYTETSFDAIGILFCIRINTQNLRIMQKRRLPVLDTFLNLVNILMWPRFQTIMGLHIDSLKKADCKKLLPTKEPNVHFIVRRYAEFSASILTLNQGYEEAMLVNSLSRLRTELESLMYKLAAEFPEKKASLAFWINNLDHIQSILNEHTYSALDSEKAYFNTLQEEKITEFVNIQLLPHIGTLIEHLPKFEKDPPKASKDMLAQIAIEFNTNWKSSIEKINDDLNRVFTNFKLGARVLHSTLTALVLYYKRFLAVWDICLKGQKTKVAPVGIQTLLVEIKKFRSNFS